MFLLPLLAGVSVFGAFLRSEFSEENLQFYLACEQYKHSSNNFTLQRRAKNICASYIQTGSPREVLHCLHTASTLLSLHPHCLHTAFTLPPHCFQTASTLLSHCLHTASTLPSHCFHRKLQL